MSGIKEFIFEKDELANLYLDKSLSVIDIANLKGCSRSVVFRWLKKFDLKGRRLIDYDNLIGKKYNHWTIIGMGGFTKNNHVYVLCKCDCVFQTERKITLNSVRLGKSQSCGCIKINYPYEIPWQYLGTCKRRALSLGLEFEITKEYCELIMERQNWRCALSGLKIHFCTNFHKNRYKITASLDRIDSNKGYVEGNVQWVHKWVNLMKSDFSEREFKEYCRLVYLNNTEFDDEVVF